MIIRFISDIHLEFYVDKYGVVTATKELYQSIISPESLEEKVLVLAGDIGKLRPNTLEPFLAYCCENWQHVIYVPGNHEFYGKSSRDKTVDKLRQLKSVHFLDRNMVTIEGQRFLGCTLWSMPNAKSEYVMNDFNKIRHMDGQKVTRGIMSEWHQTDLNWLKANVQPGDVVVTHFMPLSTQDLINCGHESLYPVSDYDTYFGNTDCWKLFERNPKLWISGHTHQMFDVKVPLNNGESVRWVCNPLGYPEEKTGITSSGLIKM